MLTLRSSKSETLPVSERTLKKETKRDGVDGHLELLSRVRLPTRKRYGANALDANSFPDWAEKARKVADLDLVRNALYYGFQPLYDALISSKAFQDGDRRVAMDALTDLISIGTAYLTGYYTGEPNLLQFQEGIGALSASFERLENVPYRIKSRNIDCNGIYPQDILAFLRQFLEYTASTKSAVPETIVGCACGSSEVVMPLAGILNINLEFIRKSSRRGDDAPCIIPEHDSTLAEHIHQKNVLCVEDYVCTGQSLYRVMEKVRGYRATTVRGASVNRTGCTYLVTDVQQKKFNLFRLRG